jgi:hypothetical protein
MFDTSMRTAKDCLAFNRRTNTIFTCKASLNCLPAIPILRAREAKSHRPFEFIPALPTSWSMSKPRAMTS